MKAKRAAEIIEARAEKLRRRALALDMTGASDPEVTTAQIRRMADDHDRVAARLRAGDVDRSTVRAVMRHLKAGPAAIAYLKKETRHAR